MCSVDHMFRFPYQCNYMRLVEKVFLCATVGALAHVGRLAELYNLLTASTGLWEAHQIVFLFLDSVERIEQCFVQKCRENLRIVWDLSIEPWTG